jgi:hypothetical protein
MLFLWKFSHRHFNDAERLTWMAPNAWDFRKAFVPVAAYPARFSKVGDFIALVEHLINVDFTRKISQQNLHLVFVKLRKLLPDVL